MDNVFHSVLPIFLIAFLGSVIRRKWLTSDEFWRGLEKLSFYVLFPTVLFKHSSKVDFTSMGNKLWLERRLHICKVYFLLKTNDNFLKWSETLGTAWRQARDGPKLGISSFCQPPQGCVKCSLVWGGKAISRNHCNTAPRSLPKKGRKSICFKCNRIKLN